MCIRDSYQTEYGYPELFSDLTVNLHHAPLNGVNEAYIDHNFSKEQLRFIRKYKLGRVLPETVASGYCTCLLYTSVRYAISSSRVVI